jgi:hypothetical protein
VRSSYGNSRGSPSFTDRGVAKKLAYASIRLAGGIFVPFSQAEISGLLADLSPLSAFASWVWVRVYPGHWSSRSARRRWASWTPASRPAWVTVPPLHLKLSKVATPHSSEDLPLGIQRRDA